MQQAKQTLQDKLRDWQELYLDDYEGQLRGLQQMSDEQAYDISVWKRMQETKFKARKLLDELQGDDGNFLTAEEYHARLGGAKTLKMATKEFNGKFEQFRRLSSALDTYVEPSRDELMEWGERFFNQPRMFLDFYLPERMQLDDGRMESEEDYQARLKMDKVVEEQTFLGMSAALIQAGQTAPARADVAAASSAQTIADVAKRAGKRIDLTQLAATVAAQKAGSAAPAAAAAAAADAECAVAAPRAGKSSCTKATAPTAARCKRKLQQGRSSFATLQGSPTWTRPKSPLWTWTPLRRRSRPRRCRNVPKSTCSARESRTRTRSE